MAGPIGEVTVAGHDELIRLMLMAGADAVPMLGRALKEEADIVFRESQEQVPFDLGGLKGSGNVTPPTMVGADIVVEISYGNTAVKDALYQHEGHRQDGTHVIQHYGNGKKGHYLSDPMEQAIPELPARIALRLEEILHG